jgi:hypothetical protein
MEDLTGNFTQLWKMVDLMDDLPMQEVIFHS